MLKKATEIELHTIPPHPGSLDHVAPLLNLFFIPIRIFGSNLVPVRDLSRLFRSATGLFGDTKLQDTTESKF